MDTPGHEAVRHEVAVGAPPHEAFRVFTEELGSWWPVDTHSMSADEAAGATPSVTVEPGENGRIVERMGDGTEGEWGRILTWQPPGRLLIAWKPNRGPHPPTEIEVMFAASDAGTTVKLEHRGWDLLGADGLEARARYDRDWPGVLQRFADRAG